MSSQPNIVFILCDQLRPDFLSAYGANFIATPNIDAIGEAGVRFERAYSGSPLCLPARTSLLLGVDAIKHGVTDNFHFLRSDYRAAGFMTWPEMLSDAGYATAAMGKMHFYPWDEKLGFQERVIAEDKRWPLIRDDYACFLKRHGLRKCHGNEHEGYHQNFGAVFSKLPWALSVDHFVGTEACQYIERHDGAKPFALMVGFPGPHCPYDPASDFGELPNPETMPVPAPEVSDDTPGLRNNNVEGNKRPWNGVDYTYFPDWAKRKIRAHYTGLVRQIDYEVGEILGALRDKGILEQTLVIFASDHGDYLGDHNLIGKGAFYEAAIRVPLMVAGPEIPAGSASDKLVELRDVTATILGVAGIDPPGYMDSRRLPTSGQDGRSRIFGVLRNGWMNFDGNWKLHKYATGERVLFDMINDPQEQRNLAEDPSHSQLLARLEAELAAEVMNSMSVSVHDRLQDEDRDGEGLVHDEAFGQEQWRRPLIVPVDRIGAHTGRAI